MKQTVLKYSAVNSAAKLKAEVTLKEKSNLADEVIQVSDDYATWFSNPEQKNLEFETAVVIEKGKVVCGKPDLDAPFEFRIDASNVHFETQSTLYNLAQTGQPVRVKLVLLPFDHHHEPIQTAPEGDPEEEEGDSPQDAPEGQEAQSPTELPWSPEEKAIIQAVTDFETANNLWEEVKGKGITDAALIDRIGTIFSDMTSQSRGSFVSEGTIGWAVKGGPAPRIWLSKNPGQIPFVNTKPYLQGLALAQKVRQLLNLGLNELVDADFQVAEGEGTPIN